MSSNNTVEQLDINIPQNRLHSYRRGRADSRGSEKQGHCQLDTWPGFETDSNCRRSCRAVGPDFPIPLRFSQWKQQDYAARLAATPELLGKFLAPLADARDEVNLVAVGRALLVGPAWAAKVRDNRMQELLPFTPESLRFLS